MRWSRMVLWTRCERVSTSSSSSSSSWGRTSLWAVYDRGFSRAAGAAGVEVLAVVVVVVVVVVQGASGGVAIAIAARFCQ